MPRSVRKLLHETSTRPTGTVPAPTVDTGRVAGDVLLYVLFYLYLWQVVDLRLIAHGAGIITNFPVFYTGWDYFEKFLGYPGGIIEYAGALLSQLFYVGWAGAAVATAQAWLTCAAADFILRRFGFPTLRWLRFVPALILLGMYTSYSFHFVTATALTASLLFVCLYLVLTKPVPSQKASQTAISLAVFAVLSLMLYTAAGGAYLVFAGIVILYEVVRRRAQLAVVYLLFGAVLPYMEGVLAFGERPANAYGVLLPYPWEKFALQGAEKGLRWAYALYLFLPSVLLAATLWQLVAARLRHRIFVLATVVQRYRGLPAAGKWALGTVVLAAVAAGAVFTAQDRERKTLFEVDYYAYHQMWPEVLKVARRCPDNIIVMYAVNQALYHTGRLGYDMFKYPQHPDALLLTGPQHVHEYWKKFDMYIELGHMNLTENGLSECIERFGEQPSLLKRLALINLVKGRTESAKVYLRALTRTLFHAEWARHYLARLSEDPGLDADADIQQLRACVVKKDHIAALAKEDILLDPLDANPRNRMAFEYLMALYLLSRQTDRLAAHYGRIENFDYAEAPPLYQEALLLRAAQTRKPLDLHGHQASGDLYQRFEAMSQIIRRHGGRPAAASDALARDFGNTYFFYHLYRVSGMQE